ncbi:endonuclease NucS domain-containing protein [Asanoa iriomotensis]|uniref:Endonuclease NucS n=1 Tax=Asanoa iriomotensis TaxID=234613 RepID=A0ABQ4C4V3_9ACTN|nr:endonuclease NucS domain-containing protein [Asanoa iriomotensis]GIF57431.1 hypothetical protein Air01nite_35260 [Asanoa iriomotensis]
MGSETVFTVDGVTSALATSVTMASEELQERKHLQQWIIDHPEVLGLDIKVVTMEYDKWVTAGGAKALDRLDVLAVDRGGRLVVVELKRDRAEAAVTMQAINYAAMASRFSLDNLADAHAAFLGSEISRQEALQQLVDWADTINDDTLAPPRIVLVAGDFGPSITNTALFLHSQGLDIRLIKYQLYRLASGHLVCTTSQLIPVPNAEDYMVRPRSSDISKAVATAAQTRKEEICKRLVDANAFALGATLSIVVPDKVGEDRQTVKEWLAEKPTRSVVHWTQDPKLPVKWAEDGEPYNCTTLIRKIIEAATDSPPQTYPWGVRWICDSTGKSLNQLADVLP